MELRTVYDGLLNIVSGMGTGRDKRTFNQYAKTDAIRNWEELEAFYMENWVAQKIVATVALDMTREWRVIKCESLSPEKIKEYQKRETQLNVKGAVQEAIMWARLYGGAVVIPIIDGQSDVSKPLNLDSVKKGSLKGFNVVEARSITPSVTVTVDPFSPNYLLPEQYMIQGATKYVHHSRLFRFIGKPLPRFERQRNLYWGMSAIQAIRKVIMDADTGVSACSTLLHELSMDFISVKGLTASMASGQEDVIRKRFALYNSIKSMFNITLLDAEEQITSRQLSLSGMDRVLEQFYKIVSGACDVPYTRLMGQSAAGFNATGESDSRNYYDMLHNEQELQLRPGLVLIDKLLQRDLWGMEYDDFGFEYNPLWQETASEKATREKTKSERDKIYLDSGVLLPSIVASELKQDGTYDNITIEFIEDLKEAESIDDALETDTSEDTKSAESSGQEDSSSSGSLDEE